MEEIKAKIEAVKEQISGFRRDRSPSVRLGDRDVRQMPKDGREVVLDI